MKESFIDLHKRSVSKDRQILLRVLRVDRQILREDRQLLQVDRQVLGMKKQVIRWDKRVLRVGKRFQCMQVESKSLKLPGATLY